MNQVEGLIHDVRNHLGLVAGTVDILSDVIKTGRAEDLRDLKELSSRLKEGTRASLARIAELEKRLGPSEPVSVLDANEVIDSLYRLARQYELAPGASLKPSPPKLAPAKITFLGIPEHIERILENLLENAQRALASHITLEVDETPRTVQFRIKDNGYGMSELELREMGFGLSKGDKGTGKGVEIVRQLACSCRAAVDWDSIKSIGTMCRLTFRKA